GQCRVGEGLIERRLENPQVPLARSRGLIARAGEDTAKGEVERRRRAFHLIDEPPILTARIRDRVDEPDESGMAGVGEEDFARIPGARNERRRAREREPNFEYSHLHESSAAEIVFSRIRHGLIRTLIPTGIRLLSGGLTGSG